MYHRSDEAEQKSSGGQYESKTLNTVNEKEHTVDLTESTNGSSVEGLIV